MTCRWLATHATAIAGAATMAITDVFGARWKEVGASSPNSVFANAGIGGGGTGTAAAVDVCALAVARGAGAIICARRGKGNSETATIGAAGRHSRRRTSRRGACGVCHRQGEGDVGWGANTGYRCPHLFCITRVIGHSDAGTGVMSPGVAKGCVRGIAVKAPRAVEWQGYVLIPTVVGNGDRGGGGEVHAVDGNASAVGELAIVDGELEGEFANGGGCRVFPNVVGARFLQQCHIVADGWAIGDRQIRALGGACGR